MVLGRSASSDAVSNLASLLWLREGRADRNDEGGKNGLAPWAASAALGPDGLVKGRKVLLPFASSSLSSSADVTKRC